jgi:hypothetical protein
MEDMVKSMSSGGSQNVHQDRRYCSHLSSHRVRGGKPSDTGLRPFNPHSQ